MKKRYIVLTILALILAYLLFYPVPIDPISWTPPKDKGFTGDFAVNTKLKTIKNLFPGQCYRCEDIAVDSMGRIYGGSEHGEIIRFDKDGTRKVLAETGGRPLGLHFDQEGRLLIADAFKGLLRLDADNHLEVLSTEHGGKKFAFTDDLEIGPDGVIYFSDASWKFPITQFSQDIMESRANGRLLAYDPKTKTTKMLLDHLFFANGIAVSEDGSFVLVNETSRYRVTRYWLKGAKKGSADIFIDNLPAFPDGISRGQNGIFWLALASPRQAALDGLLSKPFIRKIVARLPASFQPAPEFYGFFVGLNEQGKVIYNFQDPDGGYAQITSVQQFNDKLYLGSLVEDGVGMFILSK